jgi:hypothetical protein
MICRVATFMHMWGWSEFLVDLDFDSSSQWFGLRDCNENIRVIPRGLGLRIKSVYFFGSRQCIAVNQIIIDKGRAVYIPHDRALVGDLIMILAQY